MTGAMMTPSNHPYSSDEPVSPTRRDPLAEWLDRLESGAFTDDTETEPSWLSAGPFDLRPALRILVNAVETGEHWGVGKPSFSVERLASAAGRASHLALAYSISAPARDAFRPAEDPAPVEADIIEAVFVDQSDVPIDDFEARNIVTSIVHWILEQPAHHLPTVEEVVRKATEATIAEIALTEIDARIRAEGASPEAHKVAEHVIRDLAEMCTQQALLTINGAGGADISRAIENGIRDIGESLGVLS